jgi:agmatinase
MSVPSHDGGAFLELPQEMSDPRTSPVLILPIPFEATTCYRKGTVGGPAAIVSASSHVEWYDEEYDDEPCRLGIHTLPDLDCSGASEEVVDRIRDSVARHVADGRFVLSLGGEHTVTVGCVRGAASAGPLTVVQIDAHGDLRDEYEGSPWSHACVMRRLSGEHRIVQVGTRAISAEEARFTETSREIVRVSGSDIGEARRAGSGHDVWIRRVVDAIETERVYLTIDLDGLDPAVVPAVGTPVPGGLLWYETLALLRALFAARTIVSADVVELCPIPGQVVSDFAAAQLTYRIAGHAVRARPAS